MRLALVASVAVHVGVLAWASGSYQPIKRLPAVYAPEPEPLDVVLFEEHAPVAVATRDGGIGSHATAPAGGGSPRVAVSSPHHDETPPPVERHSKYMTMRQPGKEPELALPRSFEDDFVARSPQGKVDPSAVDDPHWTERASPDEVTAMRAARLAEREAKANDELKPAGGGRYTSEHGAFTAQVDPDGTAHFDNKPDVDLKPSCLFAGCNMSFDDALMRRHGIDPYASAKRQWLEKTFDERAAIGLAHRKDELAHSAAYMQKNLAWMWQKTKDPIERKQALFELWDEVAESGDDDLVAGGQAARSYLVGFIRSHIPEGSADAVPADELAQLNAHRQSHTVFAPY